MRLLSGSGPMKSILLATGAGWLARFFALVVNLIGIPLVLQELGQTRFGLMLIVMSIGSWVGLGNVGVGRVVANIVARFFHRSREFVRAVVFYAIVASLALQSLFFCICVVLLLGFADYIHLGSDGAAYKHEFVISTIANFFTFSLWFFLSVFEGIDAGQHRRFRLSLYQIAGYLLTLVLLFTAFKAAPSLLFATLLLSSGFLIGNVLHTIDILVRHRNLFRLVSNHRRQLIQIIMLSALDFTLISLAGSIIFQFSTGMFGLIVGPDAIIDLGVFMKIMMSVAGIILSVTYPMSDLIAGRVARNDTQGAIQVMLLTGSGLLLGSAIAAIAFELYGERIISVWLRTPTAYNPLFRTMASLLIFVTAASQFATGLAIGFGHLRNVARIHAVQAILALPIAWLFYMLAGQAGILLAMNVALVFGAVACLKIGLPVGAFERGPMSGRARVGMGFVRSHR
jgi:O-antigen/teichoic acid export membrane protein